MSTLPLRPRVNVTVPSARKSARAASSAPSPAPSPAVAPQPPPVAPVESAAPVVAMPAPHADRRAPLSWLTLALGLAAIVLVCFSDPYWLAAPLGAAALGLGHYVQRRIGDGHAAAHVGAAMGGLALFLWLIIDVILGLLFNYQFSLFTTFGPG